MIAGEDGSSPLSDQAIADTLAERGIDISRRTVAKYREEAGIASSSGRRRYA
jgi:RNA polymerase sigma-54 factor